MDYLNGSVQEQHNHNKAVFGPVRDLGISSSIGQIFLATIEG